LAEVERASSIEKFRQVVNDWTLKHEAEPEGFHEEVEKQNSHILVMTDSCLPMQALGEAPLSAQVLINYDLPGKKVKLSFGKECMKLNEFHFCLWLC